MWSNHQNSFRDSIHTKHTQHSNHMVQLKRASKELDNNCRHYGALTDNDRHKRRILLLVLERLREEYYAVVENPGAARQIWRMVKMCVRKLISVLMIPDHIRVRYHGGRLRIDSESIQEAMIGATSRFMSFTHVQNSWVVPTS